MSDPTDDRCPHGVPKGERFEHGCEECDSASIARTTAISDKKARRERVVETARAAFVANAANPNELWESVEHIIEGAEAFEGAAALYLRKGKVTK
jgi:hypothetical protein